jgi:hypothetical protein
LDSKNYTLEPIHVYSTDQVLQTLDEDLPFFLKLNRDFDRKHLLDPGEDATQEDWSKVIVRAKDEIPILFSYLSKNPSVLLSTTIKSSAPDNEQQKRTKLAQNASYGSRCHGNSTTVSIPGGLLLATLSVVTLRSADAIV